MDARTYRAIQKSLRDDLMKPGPQSGVVEYMAHGDANAIRNLSYAIYEHFREKFTSNDFCFKLSNALRVVENQPNVISNSYPDGYPKRGDFRDEFYIERVLKAAILIEEEKV